MATFKPARKIPLQHPGRGAIAGSYQGKAGLYELARIAMEVTGGTFRDEVEDVLANDNHGQSKEYRTAHVYDVRDGKLARCWEQSRDLATFDDAWGMTHAQSTMS